MRHCPRISYFYFHDIIVRSSFHVHVIALADFYMITSLDQIFLLDLLNIFLNFSNVFCL